MLHRHDRGRHGGRFRRDVVVAVVVGVAAQGFARAHGGTGCPATKQRTDQHIPQTTIAHVRLVRAHPVGYAGGIVNPPRLIPHGFTRDSGTGSECSAAGDRVVGDIGAGNHFGDSGIGERADDREEGALSELFSSDAFGIPHLALTADFDFRDHDRFGPCQRAIGIDVPVRVEARVDVVGDADGVLHIGLFRGDLPRNGAVVVGTAEVVPGAAAGREAHGSDREGHPPQDVGLLHGVIPHARVNDGKCRRFSPLQHYCDEKDFLVLL